MIRTGLLARTSAIFGSRESRDYRLSSSSSAAPAASIAASSGAVDSLPPSHAGAVQTSHFGLRYEVGRIEAVRREAVGKRNAQWTRMNGLIPGLIYGRGERGDELPIRMYVKESDLRAEVNKRRESFLNTLFDIVVDDVPHRVIVRDFQMHPFKPKFISCNWFRYRPGRFPGVKVDLPLRAINEERCPAYKEGGWLLELIHKLPVYASGDEIPDAAVYDLRGKRMGEKIMASEVILSDGLTLVSLAIIARASQSLLRGYIWLFLIPPAPTPPRLPFTGRETRRKTLQ
jgi:large subunit ribosomal protein L25